MCISSNVSFGLSGLLALAGAYCVSRALRTDKRLVPLAVLPVVFSVQQFCEGWVWIGVGEANPRLLRVSALVFLFFALLFWPVWIPLSARLMESRARMKTPLAVITLLGAILGGCLFLPLVMDSRWLNVTVVEHSIHYGIDTSPVLRVLPGIVWELAYIAIVAVPLFVSRPWRSVHFGMALVLSAAASRVLFPYAAASVWCFFAAALSLYLSFLFFMHTRRRAAAGEGAR